MHKESFERFEDRFLLEIGKKTQKDREWKKVYESVFNHYTVNNLFKAMLKAKLQGLAHIISLGKEANVFKAITLNGEPRAVKIYRVETSDFRRMWQYIEGDRRFIGIKRTKRGIVEAWCKKEFRNLQIASKAGIHAPKPYTFAGNVLVMQFLGDENAAPLIKDVELSNPRKAFQTIIDDVKKLWKAGLVHTDISQFNILYWRDTPWLIDFGQGLPSDHPRAVDLLNRDIMNITRFFSKKGLKCDKEEIMRELLHESSKMLI